MHSAYHQSKLVLSRQSISSVLENPETDAETKRKLQLVMEAKAFGEQKLGLKSSKNYTTFVQLKEPFVTYIVQAAYAFELKPYHWHFPFVGEVPYKGYFDKLLALEEAKGFDHTQFDTHVRGVSAYSTLGWFKDSVLSSMMRYQDMDLVETILHETVHTTLFIKSAAEFNERMATFIGHEGMKQFYFEKEGKESPHLQQAEQHSHDQKLFSAFITQECKDLKDWFEKNRGRVSAESKKQRLLEIQARFAQQVRPHLKTKAYGDFETRELNNAILLAYKTYEYSLEDFEKLFVKMNRDIPKIIDWLKSLESEAKPDLKLKEFVQAEAR
jgi:predicted aminopeptidase